MPQVDLTALSAAELRRTLDSSRARGDAATAYEVLREMAARREARGGRRPLARRRAGAPHLVSVDLSDPLDREDAFDESAETAEPLRLHPPEPAAPAAAPDDEDWTLNLRRDEMPGRPAPETRSFRGAIGFALGIACGVGLGWWAAGAVEIPALSPALAPAAAVAAEPAVETPPAPQGLEVSVAETEAAAPAEPPAAAPVGAPEAAPEAQAAPPAEVAEAPAAAGACAAEPTPADRTICGDPALQDLQQQLRTAYAEALDAHADKGLLRQRQLAWRDARSAVADPERLAGLYRERIGKLQSAAAAARASR